MYNYVCMHVDVLMLERLLPAWYATLEDSTVAWPAEPSLSASRSVWDHCETNAMASAMTHWFCFNSSPSNAQWSKHDKLRISLSAQGLAHTSTTLNNHKLFIGDVFKICVHLKSVLLNSTQCHVANTATSKSSSYNSYCLTRSLHFFIIPSVGSTGQQIARTRSNLFARLALEDVCINRLHTTSLPWPGWIQHTVELPS